MAMDKIEGTSILKANNSPEKISSLLQEAKHTMEYLFEQKISWGDVNANNIFVTKEGNLKICDLGFWNEEKSSKALTKQLLLGAMELSRWILTSSDILENVKDRKETLNEIFKPKEFFGNKAPEYSQIFSSEDDFYDDQSWMKSIMAKIQYKSPDQQLAFLQKYMDCVIANFNKVANSGPAQS